MNILKYWYFVPLIGLLIWTFYLANQNHQTVDTKKTIEQILKVDSLQLDLDRKTFLFEKKSKRTKLIKENVKSFEKHPTKMDSVLNHIYHDHYTELATWIERKDDSIHAMNRDIVICKSHQSNPINVWLLISIIILCGVLGGLARMYYPHLESIEDMIKRLKAQMEKEEGERGAGESAVGFSIMRNELSKAEETVQEEKKNNEGKVRASNIIFGIIASSMAFLALKTFDSQVLKFDDVLDYFILTSWCLLGAIYAKSWIQKLHDRITK